MVIQRIQFSNAALPSRRCGTPGLRETIGGTGESPVIRRIWDFAISRTSAVTF